MLIQSAKMFYISLALICAQLSLSDMALSVETEFKEPKHFKKFETILFKDENKDKKNYKKILQVMDALGIDKSRTLPKGYVKTSQRKRSGRDIFSYAVNNADYGIVGFTIDENNTLKGISYNGNLVDEWCASSKEKGITTLDKLFKIRDKESLTSETAKLVNKFYPEYKFRPNYIDPAREGSFTYYWQRMRDDIEVFGDQVLIFFVADTGKIYQIAAKITVLNFSKAKIVILETDIINEVKEKSELIFHKRGFIGGPTIEKGDYRYVVKTMDLKYIPGDYLNILAIEKTLSEKQRTENAYLMFHVLVKKVNVKTGRVAGDNIIWINPETGKLCGIGY